MRTLCFTLGLLTLMGLWFGPLPELAHRSFSAHMTMHMGVVAVAVPLIAIGIARRRFDPVRKAPRLFAPIPASILELLVVWAFHAPVLHHAARHSLFGTLIEQGAFFLSSLLVWLSAFGDDGVDRGARIGAGIVALLLTSMHMTLLGALLALSPRALYVHGAAVNVLSAKADQDLGGAIMLLGGAAYLMGGLWLTAELLLGLRARPARAP